MQYLEIWLMEFCSANIFGLKIAGFFIDLLLTMANLTWKSMKVQILLNLLSIKPVDLNQYCWFILSFVSFKIAEKKYTEENISLWQTNTVIATSKKQLY